MKPEMQKMIKHTLWGAVAGAIVTIVVGFNWGGWNLSSTTRQVAQAAVVSSQATICAAQFKMQDNHAAAMVKFNKMDRWSSSEFITKGGWDKMPGQSKASDDVAKACAEQLNNAEQGNKVTKN